jgi:hypothetical protein
MEKCLRSAIWLVPLAMQSADSHAWGLYTHVYFAQCLVWGVVLADPAFRRALRKFPEWVATGACLPDLALVGHTSGTAAFRDAHSWSCAERLLRASDDDRDRALALGYASHLLVDTVAHHHFVPLHERAWLDLPILTHAACEWAMDTHVRPGVLLAPARLLDHSRPYLEGYVAARFGCGLQTSRRALHQLTLAERALRGLRVPGAVYRLSSWIDSRMRGRFDRYLRATTAGLSEINALLAGERPALSADPESQSLKEDSASSAPRAAPASTSLG